MAYIGGKTIATTLDIATAAGGTGPWREKNTGSIAATTKAAINDTKG